MSEYEYFDKVVVNDYCWDWLEKLAERSSRVSLAGVNVVFSEYVPRDRIILMQGDKIVGIVEATTDNAAKHKRLEWRVENGRSK